MIRRFLRSRRGNDLRISRTRTPGLQANRRASGDVQRYEHTAHGQTASWLLESVQEARHGLSPIQCIAKKGIRWFTAPMGGTRTPGQQAGHGVSAMRAACKYNKGFVKFLKPNRGANIGNSACASPIKCIAKKGIRWIPLFRYGPGGTRTHDLCVANAPLSHLSYKPADRCYYITSPPLCQQDSEKNFRRKNAIPAVPDPALRGAFPPSA